MEAMVFVSSSPVNRKENPLKEYLRYLYRYTRSSNITLKDANKEFLCREVAKEYGVSNKELKEMETSFDLVAEGEGI